MDPAIESILNDLFFWCTKKPGAFASSDIPAAHDAFRSYMRGKLFGVDVYQEDLRLAELLLALTFWCRQAGATCRLYPADEPRDIRATKMWFGGRVAIILGKIKM